MKRWAVRRYGTKFGVFDGDELLYIAASQELADDIIREANGLPAEGKRIKKVIDRAAGRVYWSAKDAASEIGTKQYIIWNWIASGFPRNGYDMAYLAFEEEEKDGNRNSGSGWL